MPRLNDMKKRKWEKLIVWSVDRLGRDMKELIKTLSLLDDYKVSLYSYQQNLDTDDSMGRMFFYFVSIFSAVRHYELFNAIKEADLFVMSSISEGFPMAPAEAMVLGTPVIATKVGGIPELIVDGVSGILLPSKDSTRLADSIKITLNDLNLRNKLTINGKKRIEDKFTPTKICNKLLSYYSEVLKK